MTLNNSLALFTDFPKGEYTLSDFKEKLRKHYDSNSEKFVRELFWELLDKELIEWKTKTVVVP